MAETKKTKDAEETSADAAKKSTGKAKADKPVAEKKPAAEKSSTSKAKSTAKSSESTAEAKGSTSTAASPAKRAAKAPVQAEGNGGTLRVHHLRPAPGAHTAKTRVGRGEASKGKTAGRGTKGTKARYQVPQRFEGGQMPMHMRLPKLRGFKNPFRTEYQVVNLDTLVALYPEGGAVTVEDLVAKGAVRKGHPVKVLGTGDVSVKLSVAVHKISASAKDKILAAGGQVEQD